jgi:hypothetical protein
MLEQLITIGFPLTIEIEPDPFGSIAIRLRLRIEAHPTRTMESRRQLSGIEITYAKSRVVLIAIDSMAKELLEKLPTIIAAGRPQA